MENVVTEVCNDSKYRYGWNTQLKVNEIAGLGNHNTALYWEEDPRTARRWNLDPVDKIAISNYAVNRNSPIIYMDPLGDYNTKFGAKVANFFHRGKGVGKNANKDSKNYGKWFYKKDNPNFRGKDGETIIRPNTHYGSDGFGNAVDNTANFIGNHASEMWSSPLARYLVPDFVSVGWVGSGTGGTGLFGEKTFYFVFRGQDPGIYTAHSVSAGFQTSISADVGVSYTSGYFASLNLSNFSSTAISGKFYSGSAGLALELGAGAAISGGVDVGVDPKGQPVIFLTRKTFTVGTGIATPIIGNFSTGYTSPLIRIVSFKLN